MCSPTLCQLRRLMAFQDGHAGIFGSYCANLQHPKNYLIRRIMIVKVSSGDRNATRSKIRTPSSTLLRPVSETETTADRQEKRWR
jgi:hypothetical protein